MAGSTFGTVFRVTTFGESHGKALGVIIDGVPAGLRLSESAIQPFLDRRKPGTSRYTTARRESDRVQILSGVFEGMTTGTPVAMMVENSDQHSSDYDALKDLFRPGHADYTYLQKYGMRDHRGGGRSSGRETIGRVCAGAVASLILRELGIRLTAYTVSIGPVSVNPDAFNEDQIHNNPFCMPDPEAALRAAQYTDECIRNKDSCGGIVECRICGLPAGIGDPVFDKLDACLAKAICSIGAVKGFETGAGFGAASMNGSACNDPFSVSENGIKKDTNHAGGILGGISDGSELIFRAAIKPTPSIGKEQATVTTGKEPAVISIQGRHDPVIVPRAVVVIESMAAITILDLMMTNMSSQLEYLKRIYL